MSEHERLRRPFRAIVFDWDGTAVEDRSEDASHLAELVEALLRIGVWVVVVTGTNFGHVERQLCRLLGPAARRHLLVCTNRGSEVYGFGRRGGAVRRWLRMATPGEERKLTAVAEGVRDAIAGATGLPVRIVYDRLNRRKIDLIPEPEWADPPKSRIGELLAAVEARLHAGGLDGGLAEVVRLTARLAGEHGLSPARITSDVKHVEVGLTDKGDSLTWVRRCLLQPEGISMGDVLVGGDEFGQIAGFAGSDDRLRAGTEGAVVVSVGKEPNGVPAGVIHLPGGPARFRALLTEQVTLHRQARSVRPAKGRRAQRGSTTDLLQPPTDPAWRLEEHGFRPALEHEIESRFATSNGFLGVRASLEEPTRASRPRTYVAGLFDVRDGRRGPAMPALVPGPDWLHLRIDLAGERLSLEASRTESHTRVLDLRRGILLGDWHWRDGAGHRGRVRTARLLSLADRRLAVQLGMVEVDTVMPVALEARLDPPGAELCLVHHDGELAEYRTNGTARQLAVAGSARLRLREVRSSVGGAVRPEREPRPESDGPFRHNWGWQARQHEPATFERIVSFARGNVRNDPGREARDGLRRARRRGVRSAIDAHARAWADRWADSDVVVDGDTQAQRALRFGVYHLIGAANPADERVSIGARALTGDGYLGHVFWDTEIFLLPFYTLTWPTAARALLMYRYHTLPAARAKAARLGYRGALYAWESTDTGEETTPSYAIGPDGRVVQIRCGTDEQHISADVAYAVWQYWQATGDAPFLLGAGGEMILETARFWASRARQEADGRRHIRGVIGPDEYHEGVDDNAYTNVMARWNLERGLEVGELLKTRWPECWSELGDRLGFTPDELDDWQAVADELAILRDPRTGVLEQFAGFSRLEEVNLASYASRTAPMDVLLGPERTRRSQVIKQADVVMLLALHWDDFTPEERVANFRYYEPRCGHGSSLSPAMHALVAARLGDLELASAYFDKAAAIDLSDSMGNAALGVHIGALGGLWQAAVLGFGGVSMRADRLRLDPRLPACWQGLRFPVQWQGRTLRVEVERESATCTVTLLRGRPVSLSRDGVSRSLRTGDSLCWRLGQLEVAAVGASE
jgi:trehalose/maltose hydrolase-like predicted phosphorylase